MSERTMKLGNAPAIPLEELLKLKGMVCAVEFETRELLAFGRNWNEVQNSLKERDLLDRSYYKYAVPESFRHEVELKRNLKSSQSR